MPAKKAKAGGHHHQAQPVPQPSDYETDAPAHIDVAPPPPRSNEELNLSVLRRHYPEVASIQHVASYTVLYTFNLETQTWEKVGVEGTLFICALTPSLIGADRFSAIMLNRRGLENFAMELVSDDQIEIMDEIICLTGEEQQRVYGLWVFADPPPSSTANARTETADRIREVAKQAAESRIHQEQLAQNGIDGTTEQVSAGYPMGRTGSLREMMEQQRDQDAGFSMHNHHSPAMHAGAQNDVLSQLFMKAKQNYNGVG